MKHFAWFALSVFLVTCQPQAAKPVLVYLVDGDRLLTMNVASGSLALIAAGAGLAFSPADRFLLNGLPCPPDMGLPADGGSYTIQLRRAVNLTLVTPNGQETFQSAADTIGQALTEHGLTTLYAQDFVSPPIETPLNADITVTYRPARDYTVSEDGVEILIKSSAQRVGQVLASAGIPLLGLDYSLPDELDESPMDGQIKVIRVSESVLLEQNPIPFSTRYEYSPDLTIDSQNLLQAGQAGLTMSRVRVRYEDGIEVSRTTESETVVRQPVDKVIGMGTKIEIKSLDVPGGQVQYWRAVQMYATSYSPCRSGVPGRCFTGTASGIPVKHGVVAMSRAWYNAYAGTQVYIPGYGVGVVADLGGGFPDGRAWIDLGYSDDDWQNWGSWVTVYFLAPPPATIPDLP